jgi:hypothetical protein
LKNPILLVREAGWGVIVVETIDGAHYLFATAFHVHHGDLLGDARKWAREHGYLLGEAFR